MTTEADTHDMEMEIAQGYRMRRELEEEHRKYLHHVWDIAADSMRWACTELAPNPDCVRPGCTNRAVAATCARCGTEIERHQTVRWQWGAKVHGERICPPPVGEVFEGGILPSDYFLPLLDDICFMEAAS